MPLRKQGTIIKGLATVVAAGALVAAAPAVASAACVQAPTTKAFAKYNDTADYSLAPGGDFESSAGWTFTGGASITSGNESLGVTAGSKSLSLPVGATATSPAFCVDQSNPYFRFVAKPSNAIAGYKANVIYKDSSGSSKTAQFTSSADQSWGSGAWNVAAVSPLATKIPLSSADATASVQLQFVSTGNQIAFGVGLWGQATGGSVGTTLVDSVMVDPYRRG